MSLGGMLGAALSGGANAAGEIARGNIQRQGQLDLAREMALIDEERAKRVREANFNFENDPANVATRAGTAATLARGAATTQRGIDLDRLRDPELTAAEREKADRDAAAALERETARIRTLAPEQAKAAGLIADAQGKSQAKFREPKETEAQKLTAKIQALEAVLGRPLTDDERRTAAGLEKPKSDKEDGLSKWARDLVMEGVKAGTIAPEDAPAKLKDVQRGFLAAEQTAAAQAAVARARAEGKVDEAVAEARQRGFSEAQLSALFTPQELRAAGGDKPGRARREADATMAQISTATLREIADDPRHPRRRDADEELKRRREATPAVEPAPGYNYGDPSRP